MKKIYFYFLTIVLFVLSICTFIVADTIHLFDGESYEGEIVEEDEDYVVVETDEGIMEFYTDEIDHIEKESQRKKRKQRPKDDADTEEVVAIDEQINEEPAEEIEETDERQDEESEEIVEDLIEEDITKETKKEVEGNNEEAKDEPLVIKPKITGSGKYKTY